MNNLQKMVKPIQNIVSKFRQTSTRNKIIAVVAVALLAFLVVGQVRSSNKQPEYVTEPATQSDIAQIVSETGNIETTGRVDVYSSSTGIIEEMYVKNGDSVKVNQNLFKIRSTATDQEKAVAYASYQNALSSLKMAEQNKQSLDGAMWMAQKTLLDTREAKRVKDDNKDDYEDLEQQSIDAAAVQAEKNFTAAEKKYIEADSAIAAAKAQVSSAWLAYQSTQNLITKAPSAGTIANLSFKEGDKVSAGSAATGMGSSVLTIADFSKYTVKLSLNEVDIPEVQQGQSAQLTLDAFPGRTFSGTVAQVDSLGTNTSGVITYDIVVEITDPEDSIRPGMTANVDIKVAQAEDVLTVPNSAVKPYEGKKAVQVIDPQTNEAKYVPVEVGIKSPERTEIKSGISEGTEVITGAKNSAVEAVSNNPFRN